MWPITSFIASHNDPGRRSAMTWFQYTSPISPSQECSTSNPASACPNARLADPSRNMAVVLSLRPIALPYDREHADVVVAHVRLPLTVLDAGQRRSCLSCGQWCTLVRGARAGVAHHANGGPPGRSCRAGGARLYIQQVTQGGSISRDTRENDCQFPSRATVSAAGAAAGSQSEQQRAGSSFAAVRSRNCRPFAAAPQSGAADAVTRTSKQAVVRPNGSCPRHRHPAMRTNAPTAGRNASPSR